MSGHAAATLSPDKRMDSNGQDGAESSKHDDGDVSDRGGGKMAHDDDDEHGWDTDDVNDYDSSIDITDLKSLGDARATNAASRPRWANDYVRRRQERERFDLRRRQQRQRQDQHNSGEGATIAA